jgi:hypothetical protein
LQRDEKNGVALGDDGSCLGVDGREMMALQWSTGVNVELPAPDISLPMGLLRTAQGIRHGAVKDAGRRGQLPVVGSGNATVKAPKCLVQGGQIYQ